MKYLLMRTAALAMAGATLLSSGAAGAQSSAAPPPDAAASDPRALGWMVGSPPPADKQIRASDLSFLSFPRTRWSFSNWRNLFPTAAIRRGESATSPLPRMLRSDIDAVTFMPIGGTAPVSWKASLAANYTDGIIILHRGRVVYENYAGALDEHGQHIAFSVTKSFVGLLAATYIAEGKLDPAAPVSRYIPELAASGFGNATVDQVLDMTTAIKFNENYTDPNAEITKHGIAGGLGPRPPGYSGPEGYFAYATTVPADGVHGAKFKYRSVNTDVAGWLVERVGGARLPQLLERHFWQPMGMEQDAYMGLDRVGTSFAAGGLNTSLRDLARFGEMVRMNGRWQGRQIAPAAAIAAIKAGGDPEKFDKAAYTTLPGWSYRRQWWISHDDHGAFMARGVYGQAIYIDPKAEMVIARYASHPVAGNVGIDPMSLPAYRAVAKHLLAKPKR
jgi:CubicO group peptidase (beta-lactamase class C family)